MSTNLFDKYYNNPKKSYIYTDLQCNSASADETSFDINEGAGEITTNSDVLSKIDLTGIHVPLTQYENNMRIIEPNSFIYIKGISGGLSYMSKSFGEIPEETLEDESWVYTKALLFAIKYIDNMGGKKVSFIEAKGSYEEEKSCIEECQKALDGLSLKITVSLEGNCLKFDSQELGYEFWIENIVLCNTSDITDLDNDISEVQRENDEFGDSDVWIKLFNIGTDDVTFCEKTTTNTISQTQYRELYTKLGRKFLTGSDALVKVSGEFVILFENIAKYIPAQKYKNGAMKGCILVAIYPEYNAESIYDHQKSLKIGTVRDRIKEYYDSKQGFPFSTFVIRDVVDSYTSEYENNAYNKWSTVESEILSDDWIEPDEIIKYESNFIEWDNSVLSVDYELNSIHEEVKNYPTVGLKGYCIYLSKIKGWESIGQAYMKTTVDDDESTDSCNLMRSFIIFNPNEFPVKVNYMTFR